MDQLPLELLQRILTHLDLKALKNAALSCRSIFYAFKGAETLITGEILLRQIHYDVLPEAILVNKSWNFGQPSVDKGIKFAENLKHREPAPTKWNLADALPLAQFHEKISYLATQAACEALEKQPRFQLRGELAVPTYEELCRFERALYRFQLYCNVVGRLYPDGVGKLGKMFFNHFAAWENEQLACIHEHLVREVSKPFNYLVEHDVTWGYLHIPYIDEHSSEYAQEILAGGIERIYHLSKASDYEQVHALLSRGEDGHDKPFTLEFFLARGLECGANPLIPPLVPLSEMDEYDKELVVGKPFYREPDPGPASMWEWLNRDDEPGDLVAHPSFRIHRQWAFPFWDSSRLKAAGLLGDPEIPGYYSHSELELEMFVTPSRLAYLEKMRKHRTEIWKAAGHGQYFYKDSKEVKWWVPKYDHGRTVRLARPRSLEEAGRLLKGYTENGLTNG